MLAGGKSRGYGLWLALGAALGLAFSLHTGARFAALTERYDGRTVRLIAAVEDVQAGYTRSTVRARLRVEEADGEAAAFCCQCDGLPLCEAGERIEGWFSLEAPAPTDRPDRYADGVGYYLETKDSATRLFFNYLPKGTHVITYETVVTSPGSYNVGIATVQSQYAPQIVAHSAGSVIEVK